MHLLTAALLGAVQGLTEFLPVSSTAHLLIGERLLGFQDPGSVFAITIQFGSILAVMWLYRATIWRVVRGLPSDPRARRFALTIALAVMPALAVAGVFGTYVRWMHERVLVIAGAFIVGGVIMLIVERYRPVPVVLRAEETPVSRALAIGVCQTVALVPGVSRSGATIVGGLLAGLDRAAAAEFSFFLAMPTMAAAFAHDLWEVRHHLTPDRGAEIAVGFVMAFVAAALVVRPFLRFVSRAGFGPFAWYRIAAGAAILAAVGLGAF
ncbi:MAG TPA: undecaprenyl-diphosphate phosphatase [Vicinamibacterales bacterium]|nr:undecaprenyl-diphosphate phosphatase [Vicinamibacterales bacterium]